MKPIKKTVKIMGRCLNVTSSKKTDYNKDFYQWTKKQSKILKNRDYIDLDIINLVEEIQSLGKRDLRALKSQFIVLLLHMLKIRHQPNKKTKSWESSIKNSKNEIELLLDDSPSLKKQLKNVVEYAYEKACKQASEETGLHENIFPKTCPWEINDLL